MCTRLSTKTLFDVFWYIGLFGHVSIAEPDALALIYAHENGALKSEFYDAFVPIRRGIFNTRDRYEPSLPEGCPRI